MIVDTVFLQFVALVGLMVIGLGVATRRIRWGRIWASAGACVGLLAYTALAPFLPVASIRFAGVLMVGTGIAVTYPTVFRDPFRLRPDPRPLDPEAEKLWRTRVAEIADSMRVVPADWALTVALLVPPILLIWLASELQSGPLAVPGMFGALGPAVAAARLLQRSQASKRLTALSERSRRNEDRR